MALRRRQAKRKCQGLTNLGSSLRQDGFLAACSTEFNANLGGPCAFLLRKSLETGLKWSNLWEGQSNVQRTSLTQRRCRRLCGNQLLGRSGPLPTRCCRSDRNFEILRPDMSSRRVLNGQTRRLSIQQRGRNNTRLHLNRFQPAPLFSRGTLSLMRSIHTAMVMLFMCIIFAPRPTEASVKHFVRPRVFPSVVPTKFLAPRSLTKHPNGTAEYRAEMGMDLVNCGLLSDESTNLWEITTSAFIFESFLLREEEDMLRLNVTSKMIEQMAILGNRRLDDYSASTFETNRLRRQQTTQPLRVLFDVLVSFQSSSDHHNIEQWIWDAFGTGGQRTLYIFALKETGDKAFDNVQAVTVYTRDLLEDNGEQEEQQGNNTTLIIVAAVLGGLSCVTLVGLLGYLRSASKKDKEESEQIEGNLPPGTNDEVEDDGVVAVIDTSNAIEADAVSTLGGSIMSAGFDPLAPLDGAPHQEEALGYASYESNKADPGRNAKEGGEDTTVEESGHQGPLSIGPDSFGSESIQINKQSSVVSDDVSFERQYSGTKENNTFEVAAPAGKLGVIIDTPENSPPTVFAIKDTSPLAGAVTVGDQLVSVDGANTTKMSSVVVSQLLFDKAENPTRILVFCRGSQY